MPDFRLHRRHRATLERLFSHPVSHNIAWHDIVSLIEHVGTIEEGANGRFTVTIGEEIQVFDRPRDDVLDDQQVIDLRRMMAAAGAQPGSTQGD